MDQFIEHAVKPDADGEGAFPGLDVDVAGAGLDGVDEEVIDQRGNFNALLVRNRLQITSGLIHRMSLVCFGDRWSDILSIQPFMASRKIGRGVPNQMCS